MGRGTMLVPQDVVRRDMLKSEDKANNPSIELIYRLAMYGQEIGYDVILEGILSNKKYSEMLERLIDNFSDVYAFYFDISFGETLKRHATKSNAHEFGEKEMREWWKDKDYLGIDNEHIITDEISESQVVDYIFNHVTFNE